GTAVGGSRGERAPRWWRRRRRRIEEIRAQAQRSIQPNGGPKMRGWFGPFRLERQVGRGGLGAVYRAVDTRTGATVALKMLPPGADPMGLTRLRREFAALRTLSSEHRSR